jgi:hypothetical protein
MLLTWVKSNTTIQQPLSKCIFGVVLSGVLIIT